MSYKIVLYMEPVPKGRPRFHVMGRRVITRTPERTSTFENAMRMRVIETLGRREYPLYPKGTPVALDFDFIFRRPKKECRVKDPFGLVWKKGVPDLDNLQKGAMDALKGIFWEDDAQVVDLRSRKMYADKSLGRKGVPAGDNVRERICIHVREAHERPSQLLCTSSAPDRLDLEIRREYTPLIAISAPDEPMQPFDPEESGSYTEEDSGALVSDRTELDDLFEGL